VTRRPRSTYRLQITSRFTLDEAAELLPYLRALGVDWVYCSPLLAAAPGSSHGYDVVDATHVDPARGGREGLERLAAAAHGLGMGVLVDIVPNHMGVGVPEVNAWWWDVLRLGPASAWAPAFDIDWAAGNGRLRIPVLGEAVEDAAASGALRIEDGELRYHEHRYPLAPGTEPLAAPLEGHAAQHYELVHWTRADAELNYRRFFAVNELAALRVEAPEVFDATHREILAWVGERLVDGLRVDHPDGLAAPGRYLDRLARETDDAYVVVEKILERGEELPPHWATAGTTGYDALGEYDRVLVDPAGEAQLDALDAELRGGPVEWPDMVHEAKRAVADGILGSEGRRLVRDLLAEEPVLGDAERLADAVAELLACFPVYRSYLPYGSAHLERAAADARRRRPELGAELDAVLPILRDGRRPSAIRFQQTTGMVMAKGVEDTAFYRTSPLASLTEVGGDPAEFCIDVPEFHRRQEARLARWPASMTTLTTHDTKRGEDTRARITALAEIPDEWAAFVRRRRAAFSIGDGPFEHLLWQTLVGAWPREREALHGYAEKAAREAATSTSWTRPDAAFEARLHELVDRAFDDPETRGDLEAIVARLAAAGWSNGLAAKLLQLAGPGIPDVYQGSELWERSLVDPDNRRPVDFDERRRVLGELESGVVPAPGPDGAAKLLVVMRTLRARRDEPERFDRYRPLDAVGPAADHAIAVDRGGALVVATRLPIGLERRSGWADTLLLAPSGRYRDAFTGALAEIDGAVSVARLLRRLPVALLLREDA